MDIFGLWTEAALGGERYFLSINTSPNRYVFDESIAQKSEAHNLCPNHRAWFGRGTGPMVKRVHCHNAKEVLVLKIALRRLGISMTTASSYRHQPNGLSEQIHRTLIVKVRSVLKASKLKKRYFGKHCTK